jgi:protein TonB
MAAALDGWTPGPRAGGDRALAYALLASVALHAVLMFALHAPRFPARPSGESEPPLVAYLVPARAAPAKAPQPAATPPRPESKTISIAPEHVQARHRAPASPKRHRVETPKRSEATIRTASESATPPSARPSDRVLPAAQAPQAAALAPGEAAPGPAASAAASADRAAALEQYRRALIAEARRYRDYPLVALDKGWRGKVDVRMAVAADGALASLGVNRGSGHEVLDRQALEMIRKAKPLAPIPPALRGHGFTVDIPVIFDLREPSA